MKVWPTSVPVLWVMTTSSLISYNTETDTATTVYSGLSDGYGVSVAPNGDVWFTDSGSGNVYRWNGSSATVEFTTNALYAVMVDTSGDVWVGADGAVKRWDGSTLHTEFSVYHRCGGLAMAANGDVWYSDGRTGELGYWDGSSTTTVGFISRGRDVAIAPNGDVYIADRWSWFAMWDGSTFTDDVLAGEAPQGIAFDNDGYMWTSGDGDKIFRREGGSLHVKHTGFTDVRLIAFG